MHEVTDQALTPTTPPRGSFQLRLFAWDWNLESCDLLELSEWRGQVGWMVCVPGLWTFQRLSPGKWMC